MQTDLTCAAHPGRIAGTPADSECEICFRAMHFCRNCRSWFRGCCTDQGLTPIRASHMGGSDPANLAAAGYPTIKTIDLCAGPGGWEAGAALLPIDLGIVGVELADGPVATGRAAGYHRIQADMRTLNPLDFVGTTGLIASPPCPTFSASGKRSATSTNDYQLACDSITAFGMGDDADWQSLPERITDIRTALVVEAARWALLMPDLEWMVAEQVPGVEYIWEDVAAEMYAAGWQYVNVLTVEARDFGAAARRKRTFMVGNKYGASGSTFSSFGIPTYQPKSMAEALGWSAGHCVRTRGNRRPTGGNLFSADGASWCLTEKARTWERDADGLRLTAAEAGLLQGFRADHPWQGSRTSQFKQAGDVVSPLVAAAILGAANGVPAAVTQAATIAHLEAIYGA